MVVILPYCIKAKRCEHNALGYWSGLALCLTKVRSSRARCPATALITLVVKSVLISDLPYTYRLFAQPPVTMVTMVIPRVSGQFWGILEINLILTRKSRALPVSGDY